MSDTGNSQIDQFVPGLERGDPAAVQNLMPLVYDELRRLAQHLIQSERADPALQATALVHEAYLRLVGQTAVAWQGRAHFFAIAAKMIRRALIDHTRERDAQKRGGRLQRVTLHDSAALMNQTAATIDLLALDEALKRLETLHARQARVVELRFFGGLTVEETAEVLGVSARTVKDDWRFARVWLQMQLETRDSA